MGIEELKSIKPSIRNFIFSKKEKGFKDYTFEELCKFCGYEEAVKYARAYETLNGYCTLVLDYCEIHKSGKGYKFFVRISGLDLTHSLEIETNEKGEMEIRDGQENINDFIKAKRYEGYKVSFVKKYKV
jgi:hypothetical protein